MEKLPKDQKYYYDVEISKAKFNESASYTLNSGEDHLPDAVKNKHIGSNFDTYNHIFDFTELSKINSS